MTELISIAEAAKRGIQRLRKPIWASKFDHLKIDIVNGAPGIWVHLYAPFNKECNGRDPVDMLIFQLGPTAAKDKEFLPYSGPLPDSDEYKAEVAVFDGCLHTQPNSF